jgi:hypothetical protein
MGKPTPLKEDEAKDYSGLGFGYGPLDRRPRERYPDLSDRLSGYRLTDCQEGMFLLTRRVGGKVGVSAII